jgi:predicted DNA binding CopG/RHH family protein
MNDKSTKIQSIDDIAQQAHSGADISEHFTGEFKAKQQVSIAFPLELLKRIDSECQRHNITRQEWIQLACDEKIRETSK